MRRREELDELGRQTRENDREARARTGGNVSLFAHQCRIGNDVRAGDQIGRILGITPARVRVRIRHGAELVAFGQREFTATRYEYGNWSRNTCVEMVEPHASW